MSLQSNILFACKQDSEPADVRFLPDVISGFKGNLWKT